MNVQFRNTTDTKWNNVFDSHLVESKTGSGVEAETSLSLGSSEVLKSTNNVSTTTSNSELSLGIIEILGSGIVGISIDSLPELTIGIIEVLSSNISITSNTDAFITLGVAVDLSSDVVCQSVVINSFSIGIIEVLGTSISSASLTAGSLSIGGGIEYLTGTVSFISISSTPEFALGIVEILSSPNSIQSSVSTSQINLGVIEYLASTSSSVVDLDSILEVGGHELLRAESHSYSNITSTLDLGIVEILGSNTITVSIAQNIDLILGQLEVLESSITINSIVNNEFSIGQEEELSSSINISDIISTSTFSLGIIEVTSGAIVNDSKTYAELTLGGENPISSTNNIESIVSGFINIGTTETLSSSTNINSLSVNSYITIGKVELVSYRFNITQSISNAELVIGIDEYCTANTEAISKVESTLTIGHVELVSSTTNYTSEVYQTDLTIGIENELTSSVFIESQISSFINIGSIESLSSTSNIQSIIDQNLLVGQIEVLSSSYITTSYLNDIDLLVGRSEDLVSSTNLNSNTYGVLLIGHDEELSASININSTSVSNFVSGGLEVLTSTIVIDSYTNVVDFELGIVEVISSNSNISTSNISILSLGVSEGLSSNININSLVSISTLELGEDVILESSISAISYTEYSTLILGLSEELSSTILLTSETTLDNNLSLGRDEIFDSSISLDSSIYSSLTVGISEILSSSNVTVSYTISDLIIGHVEVLSHTATIESIVSGTIVMGATTPLSATANIILNVTSEFAAGIVEWIYGDSFVTSDIQEMSLDIGQDEILTSSILLKSNVDSLLSIGVTEILATQNDIVSIVSDSSIEMGEDEDITGVSLSSTSTGYKPDVDTLMLLHGDDDGDVSQFDNNVILTNAIVDTDTSRLGGSSYQLDGSDSRVICYPSSNEFDIGTGDYSLETWFQFSNVGSGHIASTTLIASVNRSEPGSFKLFINRHPDHESYPNANFNFNVIGGIGVSSFSMPTDFYTGVWYHAAVTRKDNITRGFFNGSKVFETEGEYDFGNNSPIQIGHLNGTSSTSGIIGNMDEIRFSSVSRGEIIFPRPFTPYSDVASTELTLGIDENLSSSINIKHSVAQTNLLVGVVELISSECVAETISFTPELRTGVPEELSSTSINSTLVEGIADLGVAVDLNVNLLVPTQAGSNITLGVDEAFWTWAPSYSNVISNLSLGVIEQLSGSVSFASTDISLLTIGQTEIVGSTSASNGFLIADLTIGINEDLNSSIDIISNVTSDMELGVEVDLTSTINIYNISDALLITGITEIVGASQSIVSYAEGTTLEFGTTEVLESTSYITYNITAGLSFGIETYASASSDLRSNIPDSTLTVGMVEILSTGTIINSIIPPVEAILGSQQEVESTINIISETQCESLILGIAEMLSSSNITTLSTPPADISLGNGEILSGSTGLITLTTSGLILGFNEILTATINNSSDISNSLGMIIGIHEDGNASAHIESNVSATWLYIPGSLEQLSSTINIQSNINDPDAFPFAGDIDSIVTISTPTLVTGIEEITAASIAPTSGVASELTLGLFEAFSANNDINTSIDSELTIGHVEELTSMSLIESIVESEITYGINELVSTNIPLVSSTSISELTIGHIEELSTTVVCETSQFSYFVIGPWLETLSSTSNIQSVFDTTGLVIGVVEVAAHTGISFYSNVIAELTIGHIEELSANLLVSNETVGDVLGVYGVWEPSEVTAIITSHAIASLDLGSSDELESHNNIITTSVTSELSFGIIELLKSTHLSDDKGLDTWVLADSEVIAVLDLGEVDVLESYNNIIRTSVNADLSGDFAIVPYTPFIKSDIVANISFGKITDVSSSISITSECTTDLINPTIYVESTDSNIVSVVNDTWLLQNGIVELGSFCHVSVNVQASQPTDGITEALESNSIIQSNSVSNLVIGDVTELSSTIDIISITSDSEMIQSLIEFESNVDIESIVTSDLGGYGPLYLTSNIDIISSDIESTLNVGQFEFIFTSSIPISYIPATANLEIGIIEVLESTANLQSSASADLVAPIIEIRATSLMIDNLTVSYVGRPVLNTGFWASGIMVRSNVPDAELTGGDRTVSATCSIESNVVPYLTMGIDQILESSIDIISVVTISETGLSLTDLSGTTSLVNETWGTLKLGVGYYLTHSAEVNIDIESVCESTGLIINVIDLNSNINIISNISSELVYNAGSHSTSQTICTVSDSDLTIGIVEISSVTAIINSDVIGLLATGVIVDIGNGSGIIEPLTSGFLEIGDIEPLRGYSIITSNVESDITTEGLFTYTTIDSTSPSAYLTLGKDEELVSTTTITSSQLPPAVIVNVSETSSSINISSEADSSLSFGLAVVLEGNIGRGHTACSGFIVLGSEEILRTSCNVNSDILSNLTLGIDNELTSVVNVSLTDNKNTLSIGDAIPLSSFVDIESDNIIPALIIGEVEEINSSIYSSSLISNADLLIGSSEYFNATSIINSNTSDIELDLGSEEYLKSSSIITSQSDCVLKLGAAVTLKSNSIIISNINDSILLIGIIEELATNTTIVTFVESKPVERIRGISSFVDIESHGIEAELEIGIEVFFTSTSNISSDISIDELNTGLSEELSGTSIIESNYNIEISFGIPREFTSSIVIRDIVVNLIEMDIDTYGNCKRGHGYGDDNHCHEHKNRTTPDLQYWFDNFKTPSKLNKHEINSTEIEEPLNHTFTELLFNDDFDNDSYRYLYRVEKDKLKWPESVRKRIMTNPHNAELYIADSDDPNICNTNIYNLKDDDLILMDRLLIYRLEPENSTLVGIDYDSLQTNLSKMIYIYIDMYKNGNYSEFNHSNLISAKANLLDTCYETYLNENVFNYISQKGI